MKCCTVAVIAIILTLVSGGVRAECGDDVKNPEDGEVKAWFKNIGCQIKKGAEDLHESAKPWADKIATGAKDFGHTVAQKYDEVKHKLTSDDKPSTERDIFAGPSTEKVPLAPLPSVANAPTEKVPLAPLPTTTHNAEGSKSDNSATDKHNGDSTSTPKAA